MSLLSDEEFDKLVEGDPKISPSILQTWFGDDEFRLDMLASAMTMHYLHFQVVEQSFEDNCRLFEAYNPKVVNSTHSEMLLGFKNGMKTGLKMLSFEVDGPMFRSWLKRFRQSPKDTPITTHRLTEFDIIQDCSEALYPNGRDGDYEDKVEKKRIADWLSDKVTGVGDNAGRILPRLIFAINPAKNPHRKKQNILKYKK